MGVAAAGNGADYSYLGCGPAARRGPCRLEGARAAWCLISRDPGNISPALAVALRISCPLPAIHPESSQLIRVYNMSSFGCLFNTGSVCNRSASAACGFERRSGSGATVAVCFHYSSDSWSWRASISLRSALNSVLRQLVGLKYSQTRTSLNGTQLPAGRCHLFSDTGDSSNYS